MKKNIGLVLTVLIVAFGGYFAIFFEKPLKEVDMLVFGIPTEKFSQVLKEYEKKNNLKINITEASFFNFISVIEEKAAKGEKIADLFLIVNDNIPELADLNIISEIPPKLMSDYPNVISESLLYKEKYYGVPFFAESLFIFYNKEFVKNVPDSIEEIITLKNDLERSGTIDGLIFPSDEYYFHFPWLTYCGGSTANMINYQNTDYAPLIKELSYTKDHFKYCNFNMTVSLFKSRKAAMVISGNWIIPLLKDSGIDYGIKEVRDSKFKPFVGVKTFAVSQNSKYKKECIQIAKYLSSEKVQSFFADNGDFVPVNIKAYDTTSTPLVKAFQSNLENMTPMPLESSLKPFWLKSNVILNRVFMKNENPEAVVKEVLQSEDKKP